MAKVIKTVVPVRMTDEMARAVSEFAIAYGYVNTKGAPNLSAAIRQLVALGLDRGSGMEIAQAAYLNARADLLQKLHFLVIERYKGIAEELE